ncbi:hypothetical protein DID88_005855 [Monilinia fructigena]|uniref:Aminotransferase class I/classII large domain-containing protein n=1 Tax=Monilinia fructigena TaxID=38457 RepID=A0A395J3A5_9HELO|nr:hypothetical protein DID88_005855 [Monilinia fructigena]
MSPPTAIDVEGVTDTDSVVIPDPLTVNGVFGRRAKAGKFSAVFAAFTTSDHFKSPSTGKPKAKRWDHRISLESRSRKPSNLKSAAQYLKTPGMISLGGGLPCPDYFPIEEISIKVPTVPHFSEEKTKESGTIITAGKYDVSEGKGAYDLSIALNYGQGTGSAQMLRWVTEHTEIVCNPPYADWGCTLSVGSTSALEQTYRIFCERGDYVLSEEYTFASAVETAAPLGIKFLGVKMDAEGLLPEALDEILSNWDEKARGARKPFVLYTVPSGQNPTGATQGIKRRHAIYKVAQKHDLYILEDEPYYFLQMQPGISQIVLYKLLDESWGHSGYLQWLVNLRLEYTKRRNVILAACEKYLPKSIVSWNPPTAGMFLWLQVDWHKHPAAKTKPIQDIEQEIFLAGIGEGVLICPGSWFTAERVALYQ